MDYYNALGLLSGRDVHEIANVRQSLKSLDSIINKKGINDIRKIKADKLIERARKLLHSDSDNSNKRYTNES